MSIWNRKNIGAAIKTVFAAGPTNLTAAGAGDNTLVNGAGIDLQALGLPQSAVLAFPFKGVLASAATLSLAYAVQDSADNTNFTNLAGNVTSAAISTGGSGGTTNTGVIELDVALDGARRYIRAAYTPDLSAGGTDTANVMAVFVFGGQAELPV